MGTSRPWFLQHPLGASVFSYMLLLSWGPGWFYYTVALRWSCGYLHFPVRIWLFKELTELQVAAGVSALTVSEWRFISGAKLSLLPPVLLKEEAEAGRHLWVQGQPRLLSEALS